jgi:UDP-2-acetamido-2,6-beta-L-arabino-hexul-4-ose reductase
MKVLVTGANGFIGKNLIVSLQRTDLQQNDNIEVLTYSSQSSFDDLKYAIGQVDFIFHLAGVNRPKCESEFELGNSDLTVSICDLIRSENRNIPILYTSSIQVEQDNAYGRSKLKAEAHLSRLHNDTNNDIYIYRLPNVFGKWCKPNYNSVVATFCHNIANNLPVEINDTETELNLVHVGAVVTSFLKTMKTRPKGYVQVDVTPVHKIRLGELVDILKSYRDSRKTLVTEEVGDGFGRVLYATYISYITPSDFNYSLTKHEDPRGVFVEMIKTKKSGQFSYFTAHPGITRGGHYHHCKTEKFLVIKGAARFGFRHIITDEVCEIFTNGDTPEVVETVPGWSHDVTNIGDDELVVMLWANENFDDKTPDTVAYRV